MTPPRRRLVVLTGLSILLSGLLGLEATRPGGVSRPLLAAVITTTTTTTTTWWPYTTTTTTTTTSTTTTIPSDRTCLLTLRLLDTPALYGLWFAMRFDPSVGVIAGTDDEPAGVAATEGLTGSFRRSFVELETVLYGRIGAPDDLGVKGPVTIAYCELGYHSDPPTADDFEIEASAYRAYLQGPAVSPRPVVELVSIQCPIDSVTTTTLPLAPPDCAQPESSGSGHTVADALITLRTAIGFAHCPACVCDIDDSGTVGATDALRVLYAAIGREIDLGCRDCPSRPR